ncbi:potassium transporter TrkG, partial [Staphylococcus haemolyticus]|uniref:potassium transporter TrkG n=1 Tax=Staphylococcus haemolyticus TaxID=1283 RepID=UPI002795331B
VKILYEVISAIGTVGLTMDLTLVYTGLTELIIVIVMLFGKVCLLSMARACILTRSPRKYHY